MTVEPRQAGGTARSEGQIGLAVLVLAAADLLGLFAYMGQRRYLLSPVWIYLSLYATAFGFYFYAAARLVPRLLNSRYTAPLIFGSGVLMRLAVLHAPPSLSTDMYRYVWDGRLTLHGLNPYHYAPNAGPLKPLRDSAVWLPMEYKAYQDIYMPTSQAIFALGYALFGDRLIGFKLIYLVFDVGVMALLWRLLRALGRPPSQIVWYAWSPLAITEVSLAGHQDIVGVFFLLLAFVLVLRPRTEGAAALALVAAVFTKGFALLLLPLFCRTFGRRFAVICGAALVALGVPLWVCLPQFLHGMTQYLDFVNVNSGLFHWLNMGLSYVTKWHFALVSKICDGVILIAAVWAAWRPADSVPDLLRRAFIVLAVMLMVIPTLFPWYLLWVLPFMVLLGRRPSWAFVLLTGTVALLYTYYISIKPYWWTPLAEYAPFYAVLIWEWRLWYGRSRPRLVRRSPVSAEPDDNLRTPLPLSGLEAGETG